MSSLGLMHRTKCDEVASRAAMRPLSCAVNVAPTEMVARAALACPRCAWRRRSRVHLRFLSAAQVAVVIRDGTTVTSFEECNSHWC